MSLFRRPVPFRPVGNDTFEVNLPAETRRGLLSLAEEVAEAQTSDRPELRRLFPTAYPDDAEKDAGYQVFARDQLIEQRRAAVEVMRETLEAKTLTGEELSAWMGILNDYRLVLGTMLDVSEDDDFGADGLDLDDPRTGALVLYHEVGHLVALMVDALTTGLPEPTEDGPVPPT
jgi:hypothetical protein